MTDTVPIHQYAPNGKVLLLKCLNCDGTSHDGFVWPKSGTVAIPKNSRKNSCESGGLFGWPWGLHIGDGRTPNACAPWIVFAVDPKHVLGNIEGFDKAKACVDSEDATVEVVYYGNMAGAMYLTSAERIAWVQSRSIGSASSTGYSGSASSTGVSGSASSTGESGSASSTGVIGSASSTGESGSASSTGYSGSASSTGYSGSASSTGYSGSASSTGVSGSASSTGESGSASSTGVSGSASSTGESGSASSTGYSGSASSTGYSGSASSTGESGSASSTGVSGSASATGRASLAACVGLYGTAKAGEQGCIVLAWTPDNGKTIKWAVGIVGKKGIKAGVAYKVDGNGKLVEA